MLKNSCLRSDIPNLGLVKTHRNSLVQLKAGAVTQAGFVPSPAPRTIAEAVLMTGTWAQAQSSLNLSLGFQGGCLPSQARAPWPQVQLGVGEGQRSQAVGLALLLLAWSPSPLWTFLSLSAWQRG